LHGPAATNCPHFGPCSFGPTAGTKDDDGGGNQRKGGGGTDGADGAAGGKEGGEGGGKVGGGAAGDVGMAAFTTKKFPEADYVGLRCTDSSESARQGQGGEWGTVAMGHAGGGPIRAGGGGLVNCSVGHHDSGAMEGGTAGPMARLYV